jgi:hypothetical protein
MHAAAIKHIKPRGWTDDCHMYERDISNHAKLFGRGGLRTAAGWRLYSVKHCVMLCYKNFCGCLFIGAMSFFYPKKTIVGKDMALRPTVGAALSPIQNTAPPFTPVTQRTVESYWDEWTDEAGKPEPPGTKIHMGQQIRKYSLDARSVLPLPCWFGTASSPS